MTTATDIVAGGHFSRTYHDADHHGYVMTNLLDLLRSECLCDLTLVIGERRFRCHRLILAASSPYFRSLLCGGFKESSEEEIHIQGIQPEAFEAILQFIYKGDVELTDENTLDVLMAANHLQFEKVTAFCEEHLKGSKNPNTCLEHLKAAEMFYLTDLQCSKESYIYEHFVEVAQNDDFFSISKDTICKFLSSDKLRVPSELALFDVIRRWLEHNPVCVEDIMRHIRFGLMSHRDLSDEVFSYEAMLTNTNCRRLVTDALSLNAASTERQLLGTGEQFSPRCDPTVLIIGGHIDSFSAGQTTVTDEHSGLIQLQGVGEHAVVGAGNRFHRLQFPAVLSRNGYVYVLGGSHQPADNTYIRATKECTMFNSFTNTWVPMAPMNYQRDSFVATFLKDGIFVCGGHQCNSCQTLKACEFYSIRSNTWTVLTEYPNPIRHAAGVAIDGTVYVCGGEYFVTVSANTQQNEVHAYRDTYAYESDIQLWVKKADMKRKRNQHICVEHKGQMIILGGYASGNNFTHRFTRQIEQYDPNTNVWTELAGRLPINVHMTPYGLVQQGNLLHLFGGRVRVRNKDLDSQGPRWDWEKNVISVVNIETIEHSRSSVVLPFQIQNHAVALVRLCQPLDSLRRDQDPT